MSWASAALPSDVGDLADDVRRLFREIEGQTGVCAVTGQCAPPLDVLETDEVVELIVDLPGVPAERLRVLLKGAVVVVVGEKEPEPREAGGSGAFHLVERVFGRFARAVRVSAAFDGARANASLQNGELRITLPKIHDRRGAPRVVPVG